MGEEPARRLDSENSLVSDWSLEVEEEEERRSLDGASPFRTEDHLAQQQHFLANNPSSGPGIIRLATVDSAPMPHPAWRSSEPETWRKQQAGSYHHTLPGHMQNPPQRHLYDPNSTVRPIRLEGGGGWTDRQTSPEYPGHPFPNARIPMVTSRQVHFLSVLDLLQIRSRPFNFKVW